MRRVLLIISVFLLFASISQAATYYVDVDSVGGTCDNGNAGTAIGAPWCDLAKAGTTAVAGDLIYIRVGTYVEQISPSNSGTNGNEITWMPYNNEAVTIAPTTGSALYTTKDYHIFDHLTFMPSNPGTGNTYIVHNRGDYNTFQYCTIAGTDPEGKRTAGIRLSGIVNQGTVGTLVQYCTVTDLSDQGITMNDNGATVSQYNIIRNNTSTGHYGNGIASVSALSTMQGNLIEGNTVGGSIASDGIHFEGNYTVGNTTNWGTIVRNNISYGNGENGIDLKGSKYFVIEGNILYDNVGDNDGLTDEIPCNDGGLGGITRGSNQGAADAIIRGNIVYSNKGGIQLFTNYYLYHNTLIYNRTDCNGPGQVNDDDSYIGYKSWSGSSRAFNNITANNFREVWLTDAAYVDYNIYYKAGGVTFYGVGSYNFAQWKTYIAGLGVDGADANSVEDDPDLETTNTYAPTLAPNNYSFSPVAGSPAIDAARPITYINGTTGSVTSAVVDDSYILSDGMGVTTGDTILIGTDQVVLTDVTGTTITWTGAVTIADNDPVYWCPSGTCYSDSGPDIGAVEYDSGYVPTVVDAIYTLDTDGTDSEDTGTDYDLTGNNTPSHASGGFDSEFTDDPVKSYTRDGSFLDGQTQLSVIVRIVLESETAYYSHIFGRMDETNGLGWGIAYNPYDNSVSAAVGYDGGSTAEWYHHGYDVSTAEDIWAMVRFNGSGKAIDIMLKDTLGATLGNNFNSAILAGRTWNNSETNLSVGAWYNGGAIEANHVFDGLIKHAEIHTGLLTEAQFNTIIDDNSGGVDTEDPTVTISTSGGVVDSGTTTYQVAYTSDDNIGVTECKWRLSLPPDDSNGTVDAESPADFTGLSEGSNTLYVGCTDDAGNWGSDYIGVYVGAPWAGAGAGTDLSFGVGTDLSIGSAQN